MLLSGEAHWQLGARVRKYDYKLTLHFEDLCKSKCLFGAECIEDYNQPFCRCSLSCSDDYEPVCGKWWVHIRFIAVFSPILAGSDGNTYVNLCHLRYESCNKQQAITVTANNMCGKCLLSLFNSAQASPFKNCMTWANYKPGFWLQSISERWCPYLPNL